MKLTQVARASLEELKLDYEDFLRHRKLKMWDRNNPLRQQLIDLRCHTADDVALWIRKVSYKDRHVDEENVSSHTMSNKSTLSTKIYSEYSANAALVLLNVACTLLDLQVERLALDFENEGGFTERLYKVRTSKKKSD